MKFGRKYSLTVEVAGGGFVTLGLPFSVQFEVSRQSLASANKATFRIFNLGEQTRNRIYKDKYNLTELRRVTFHAGYEDFAPLIFTGRVKQASSFRQGTDTITLIEADEGYAMINGFTATTLGAGAIAKETIKMLAASLPAIAGAAIVGDFPTATKRGEVLFGNTWQLLQQKSGGLARIDNGQVKVLNDDEVITGAIPLISAETGLLNSPQRGDRQLEFELLFEPRITVGQAIALKSVSNPLFDGNYKVMGFAHKGMISPTVGGSCTTSVSLFLGTRVFRLLEGAPVQ